MATVRAYIKDDLQSFGYEVSDIALDAKLIGADLSNGEQEYNESDVAMATAVKTVICRLIPKLLLLPNVTEGGYSVQRNPDGIKAYYSLLCGELGLSNQLQPKVRDRSNVW